MFVDEDQLEDIDPGLIDFARQVSECLRDLGCPELVEFYAEDTRGFINWLIEDAYPSGWLAESGVYALLDEDGLVPGFRLG